MIQKIIEIFLCLHNSWILFNMLFFVTLNVVFKLLLIDVQKLIDFRELRLEKLFSLVYSLVE